MIKNVALVGDSDLCLKVKSAIEHSFNVTYDPDYNLDLILFVFSDDSSLDSIRTIEGFKSYNVAYLSMFKGPEDFFMLEYDSDTPYLSFNVNYINYYSEVLVSFLGLCISKKMRHNPKLPSCPDLSTPRSVLPDLYGKDGKTDFPKKGMDEEICFENSQYAMFPFETALELAQDYPKKWCSGGNHFGNKAFNYWIRTMKAYEKGIEIPNDCKRWLKKRERYIARHTKDFRLAGVVAMIKWAGYVNGKNGKGNGAIDGSSLDYMTSLFND